MQILASIMSFFGRKRNTPVEGGKQKPKGQPLDRMEFKTPLIEPTAKDKSALFDPSKLIESVKLDGLDDLIASVDLAELIKSVNLAELIPSVDLTKLTSSVEYSTYADARNVRSVPIGFDPEDVDMARRTAPPTKEEIKKFLEPKGQDVRDYQISIAFVRGSNGKPPGHAEVVLRDYDLNDRNPKSRFVPNFAIQHHFRPLENGNLKLLHLHNVQDEDSNELELSLDTPDYSLSFHRHVDLFRVHTTERVLKHIALQSCPAQHRILVDDCATFVYNFVMGLLKHLMERGDINEKEFKRYRKRLVQNNHTEDGSIGQSEALSRDNETSGEVTHTSVVNSTQPR